MMTGNVALIYVPGLPLWSGLADRLRRPQQCRSTSPDGILQYRKAKYGMPRRPTPCPERTEIQLQPSAIQQRAADDEGRIRQTGRRFFSTILFLAIYLATDNVLLATGVAIAGAHRPGDLLARQGQSSSAT